jgi:hypothetical protein
MRRDTEASPISFGTRCVRGGQWMASIAVPVVVGGLVGGSLGGVVTAAILIPCFGYLLRRSERERGRPAPDAVRPIPVIARGDEPVGAGGRHRHTSAA